MNAAFGALFARAGAAGVAMTGPMLGLRHDAPQTVAPEALRADACIGVAEAPAAVP